MRTHFKQFISIFPEVKLPVNIKEESVHALSQENKALPERLVNEFILPYEEDVDELTEFVPCFRIAGIKDFHALVYWKATVMNYQYVLATFTKSGLLIDRAVIAGTFSDGKVITRSFARLDDDWTITIVSGQLEGSEENYDASSSRTIEMDLLPDGKIVPLE
ncbi:MAG: hypothetical protein Kow0027_22980 [Saprospiraceae bacterium]|jgi:hypothetical protein|nr:MAG: hypothetical protein D6816_17495 [Bacteroidota bacterium]